MWFLRIALLVYQVVLNAIGTMVKCWEVVAVGSNIKCKVEPLLSPPLRSTLRTTRRRPSCCATTSRCTRWRRRHTSSTCPPTCGTRACRPISRRCVETYLFVVLLQNVDCLSGCMRHHARNPELQEHGVCLISFVSSDRASRSAAAPARCLPASVVAPRAPTRSRLAASCARPSAPPTS